MEGEDADTARIAAQVVEKRRRIVGPRKFHARAHPVPKTAEAMWCPPSGFAMNEGEGVRLRLKPKN
ncbi:hypothetical protein GCM10009075_02500 [Sphingomonas trueperi]